MRAELVRSIDSNAQLQTLLYVLQASPIEELRIDDCGSAERVLHKLLDNLNSVVSAKLSWDLIEQVIVWLLTNVLTPKQLNDEGSLLLAARQSIRMREPQDYDALWRIIQHLLQAGASPSQTGGDGETPLDWVHPTIAMRMRAAGCQHGRCYAGLIEALRYSEPNLSDWLAEFPKGLQLANRKGLTPLMSAACNETYPEMTAKLYLAGGKIDAQDRLGYNAFTNAVLAFNHLGFTALLQAVSGADSLREALNQADRAGITPLGHALGNEHPYDKDWRGKREALCLLMVQHGARLDLQDKEGKPMASYAPTKKLLAQLEKLVKQVGKNSK